MRIPYSLRAMFLYPVTILLSAFLLFLVQPIIAKQILPWFGGSAGVWTACLVFFQMLLLGGYAYAHGLSKLRNARTQATIHIALLLLSLAFLPIIPSVNWKPTVASDPLWHILGLLTVTIGMPYFLLSSTGPLIQTWFANTQAEDQQRARVYRLFALSNFGSLIGLLAYPFAVEPFATATVQSRVWSAAYALFVLACAACAWRARSAAVVPSTHDSSATPPHPGQWLFWLACAALGSVLLLAVTSHITQNVASIPFLWILPLTLYLFSFVVCFEGRGGRGWYLRRWWLLPVLGITVAMAWALGAHHAVLNLYYAIPLFCVGLFLACVFCHGELAASKPAPQYLTQFYLALAAGGALGGLLVALVAPHVFNNYWETPLALIALTLIAVLVCTREAGIWRYAGLAASLAALSASAYFGWVYYQFLSHDTLFMSRNFYGTLRVKQTEAGPRQVRRLLHGVILHGEQFTDPARHMLPSTYYGPTSGIGLALDNIRPGQPRRVGMIGLGTGTLTAYGQAGDVFRIYELDADVLQLARHEFKYLADSKAQIEPVLGDARLSMERELAAGAFTNLEQRFDVISVDAFSSDSIPVHLITREALAVYARVIKPDGVIAFHVSNRFLDLAPVVQQLAADAGFTAWEIDDAPEDDDRYSHSDWVLVTRNQAFLQREEIAEAGEAVQPIAGLRMWTDQFNNLYQILK
jgi:SAM-dependent methyltransferase